MSGIRWLRVPACKTKDQVTYSVFERPFLFGIINMPVRPPSSSSSVVSFPLQQEEVIAWAHLDLTFEDIRDPAGTNDAALLESEEQAALILDDWQVC
jgi:hypothetical protein